MEWAHAQPVPLAMRGAQVAALWALWAPWAPWAKLSVRGLLASQVRQIARDGREWKEEGAARQTDEKRRERWCGRPGGRRMPSARGSGAFQRPACASPPAHRLASRPRA